MLILSPILKTEFPNLVHRLTHYQILKIKLGFLLPHNNTCLTTQQYMTSLFCPKPQTDTHAIWSRR